MAQKATWSEEIPAQVYVLEHHLADGQTVVNVGCTSRTIIGRYGPTVAATTAKRYVVPMRSGKDAREIEKQAHKALKPLRTTRGIELPKKTGGKELYDCSFEEAVATVVAVLQGGRWETMPMLCF